MHASVGAFLNQLIDHAGLFPPAKLPLEEALTQYLHLKKASPHRWMLGRFVCPAMRLQELLPLAKSHADGALLSLTALGPQSSTIEDFILQLEAAVKAIQEFRRAWGSEEVIGAIEMPAPSHAEIDRTAFYLRHTAERVAQANLRGFLEMRLAVSWLGDLTRISQVLDEWPDTHDQSPLGLKLRCGGTMADAFPSDEQVAFFIAFCRSARLPWKATAGLHHPRRHLDPTLSLWHHGFLNVFAAGVLATVHALPVAHLVEILADRDGQNYHFEDDHFAWKTLSCTTAQIAEARANFATSFGSCSFEEPCEDLMAMGLLDRDRSW